MKTQYAYDIRPVASFREILDTSAELYADRPAFLYEQDEQVLEISYEQFRNEVKAFASFLRANVAEGSRVAVIGKNRYEWALSYFAIACGVGVVVPIDKDLRGDEIRDLILDAEASCVVYSDEIGNKLNDVDLGGIISLPMSKMSEYVELGNSMIENGDRSYEEHMINPNQLGVLLYTSGTSGVSKGVMLSQYNICSDVFMIMKKVKITRYDVAFSIAPLHHIYESNAGLVGMIYSGAAIAYNTSLRKIQKEMKIFRPTVMAVVPTILETFRNAMLKKYRQIKGGKAVLSIQRFVSDVSAKRLGKKIFSVVNEAFGGRMRLFVCGAAHLPPDIFRDFERFGIKVVIGYGLTETAPVCLMHNDFYSHPDDIGYPLSGIKAKIDNPNEEGIGELAVKGPNVMLGYYKNPEETKNAIRDGWFFTGDLAKQLPNGAYRLTGRAKSMIVSAGGKKIFPEELELFLQKSEDVAECLVYESFINNISRITAAIYPSEDFIKKLTDEGLERDSEEFEKRAEEEFNALIESVNSKFPSYKHITRLVVRKTDFIKTTTRKIKRSEPENLL